MRLRKSINMLLLAAAVSLCGGTAAVATVSVDVTSKIYGTGDVKRVPWGLPVEFEALTNTSFPAGATFRWDFGDGLSETTTEPSILHQYTFVGLPGHCVPPGGGNTPPDQCPDPGLPDPNNPADPFPPLTVSVEVKDINGTLVDMASLALRLRRQTGSPFSEEERGTIETALDNARAVLDPEDDDLALRLFLDTEDAFFEAFLEVLLSGVADGRADLERAAKADERAFKSLIKAIKELQDSKNPNGLAQAEAITEAFRQALENSHLKVLRTLDPCCSKNIRQALEKLGSAKADQNEGNFREAADGYAGAYSNVRSVRKPLAIPGDLPTSSPGNPFLEEERELIEQELTNADLGDSRDEEQAARNFQDAIKGFSEARVEELKLNLIGAAKRDEGALKSICKGFGQLRKVGGLEDVEEAISETLLDTILAMIQRAAAKFGTNPNNPQGNQVVQALEKWARGAQQINQSQFSEGCNDLAKAYRKASRLPVTDPAP